ncbi:MAG: hypothetical protein K9M15_00915 [Candidatus Marinimicrobia bacterium]|nr:hypothetical protein [Candidatus Neomarinimicrobiota bacterium]
MLEIKKLEKSEVEIAGEIPAEEFAGYWGKALAEMSKDVSVAGFRPGKVPEKILVEKFGENAILDKAAEMALGEFYPKIVREKKLEVISPPQVTVTKITKNGPLGFKLRAIVLPEIKLPEDYQAIAKKVSEKKEEVVVADKEIDDAIEYLRKMKANTPENNNSSEELKKEGEDKKEEKLPEVNDDFAKSVGKFESLAELKETIKKNIQAEKENKSKEKKRIEMMDAIINKTEVEIPEVLVEGEKRKMLNELKSSIANMGLKWEDYMNHVKKKEEEILAGWEKDALKRVKYGLLLEQLTKDLKIEISDEDITAKIKDLGLDPRMGEKEGVDKDRIKGYAFGIIRNEKIFKFLEEI